MGIRPALALDVIAILVFAIVGRSSHGEASDLLGVLRTAWPFVAGGLLGTLVGRTWRDPASLRAGVFVWVGTVVVGLVLRLATGAGAPVPFVIVTTLVLGALLLGWRAGLRAVRAARLRRSHPA